MEVIMQVANRSVIARKIAELSGTTINQGDKMLATVCKAINALIEEGWTTFKFPRLMTMETWMSPGGVWIDKKTGEKKPTKPKLRSYLRLYRNTKKALRVAHNVPSELL